MHQRNVVLAALAGAAVARPMGKGQLLNKRGICFDFGDCLIFGGKLEECNREGNNAQLFGLIGTCVPPKQSASASLGGLGSLFGLSKRHGPDDDDEDAAVVVVPAANETAVVVPVAIVAEKRQIIGDLISGTADTVGGVASLGGDVLGYGVDAAKDTASSLFGTFGDLLSIPAGILGFGGYGYGDDDKVKREAEPQIIGDLISGTADTVGGVASLGGDVLGYGVDAAKDTAEALFGGVGDLLAIPGDILGFGGYGYGDDDKVKREAEPQIISDLVSGTADAVTGAASLGGDVLGYGVDAAKDTAEALFGGVGDLLAIPGDILGFGGYGYGDDK